MNLCILCDDANIDEARQRLLSTLPQNFNPDMVNRLIEYKQRAGHEDVVKHLAVPCSASGELPATHWFCFTRVNEETHQKMLAKQKYTIMEADITPGDFLAKHGVKRIKAK